MKKGYTTISSQPTTCEILINKSRFIGYAVAVNSAEQAAEKIKEISKKHYDATHNCYAFVTQNYSKYSDDGEPQGTAGLPILDCIRKKELCDCLVIVTRYFGGIKLGAGGLVRAYTACANEVLSKAEKIELKGVYNAEFVSSYELYQSIINKIGFTKIQSTDFGDSVTVKLLVRIEDLPKLEETLGSLSKGKISLAVGEITLDAM